MRATRSASLLRTAGVAVASAAATAYVMRRRTPRTQLDAGWRPVEIEAAARVEASEPVWHVEGSVVEEEERDDLVVVVADDEREVATREPDPAPEPVTPLSARPDVAPEPVVAEPEPRPDPVQAALDLRADRAVVGLGVAATAWLVALAIVAGLVFVLLR